jgi:hypothetical protein
MIAPAGNLFRSSKALSQMQIEPARLPHWGRVKFAVKCATRVRPFFSESWPDALQTRVRAVDEAIRLASESATERKPKDGLHEAFMDATSAAGAAIAWQLYEMNTSDDEGELEPQPLGRDEAVLASNVANVAAKPATVAKSPPAESVEPAEETMQFTMAVIRQTGRVSLLELLEADFETIRQSERSHKPWWRFW